MKRDLESAIICGVCSGIAKQTGMDVTLIRLIFAIAALMGVGTPILIYIILALITHAE
jgi:phage shock protein C